MELGLLSSCHQMILGCSRWTRTCQGNIGLSKNTRTQEHLESKEIRCYWKTKCAEIIVLKHSINTTQNRNLSPFVFAGGQKWDSGEPDGHDSSWNLLSISLSLPKSHVPFWPQNGVATLKQVRYRGMNDPILFGRGCILALSDQQRRESDWVCNSTSICWCQHF